MTRRDYRTLANSPSGTIADSDVFTYDKASRMLTAVSGRYTNTVAYSYDTAGRKKTEGLTISGQTYTTASLYNSRGELSQLTYPDSTVVQRTYTARGELYQLKHAGTTVDTRTYDNGGRLVTDAYNNTVTESRTYNLDNTLAGITDNKSIGNLSYTWDANKNKTAETISGTMSNYGFSIPSGGYDDEDRLVSFNRTVGLTQSWNLSLVGDWNSVTTNGTAQARTHGPSHELLTGAGQAVSTDVKGNITVIPAALRPSGVALAITWDFDNRMATAVTGSTTVSHKYDALGRRVARTQGANTPIYAQSGQQTLCDYVAGAAPSASTYRYLFASYIDEPVVRITTSGTVATYMHRNQQYSITALTNSAGAVVERYAYTAYGVPTITNASGTVLTSSAQNNRYLYTGREWDGAISLYHYRARMYDASLGRFCSKDPIGYADGWSLFSSYFGLASTDPDGMKVGSCSYHQSSFDVSVRKMGGKNANSIGKLREQLRRILKTTVRLNVTWDFRGTGVFSEKNCIEDCECKFGSNYSVPYLERKINARGELNIGMSVPVGAAVTVSGGFYFRANFDLLHRRGGCENLNTQELCGRFSGGGELKVCVGRWLAEACVFVKLDCNIYGKCGGNGASSPTSGSCKMRFGGSGCLGPLCGEIDFPTGEMGLPFM